MRTRMSAMRRNYQILNVLSLLNWTARKANLPDNQTYFSMRSIAFWACMKPSGYLKRKLDELARAGWLERVERDYRLGITCYSYRISDSGQQMVNARGSNQLDLL